MKTKEEKKIYSLKEVARYLTNRGICTEAQAEMYLDAEDEYFINIENEDLSYDDQGNRIVAYEDVDSYISRVTGIDEELVDQITNTITEYMIEEGLIDGYDEETGDYHVVDRLVVY